MRIFWTKFCVADFKEWDTICGKFHGLKSHFCQTWKLFVADYMVYDAIFGRYYGLIYYVWQVQWSKLLFVADFMDLNTFCGRFSGQIVIFARIYGHRWTYYGIFKYFLQIRIIPLAYVANINKVYSIPILSLFLIAKKSLILRNKRNTAYLKNEELIF